MHIDTEVWRGNLKDRLSIPRANLSLGRAIRYALVGYFSFSLLAACSAPKAEPTSIKTTSSPIVTPTNVTDTPLTDDRIPLRNRVSPGTLYDMITARLTTPIFYDSLVSTKSGSIVSYKTRAELLATGEVLPDSINLTNLKGENIIIWRSLNYFGSGDHYGVTTESGMLCAEPSRVRDFAYEQLADAFQYRGQVNEDMFQSVSRGQSVDCWYFLGPGNPLNLPPTK